MYDRIINSVLLITLNVFHLVSASDYNVVISSDSPVVRGATVRFTARLYADGIPAADGSSFRFDWEDNAIGQHTASHKTELDVDTWNVTYPAENFPPGTYEVQVTVYKRYLIFYDPLTSDRLLFKLTERLNGGMDLLQQNKTVQANPKGYFVSSIEPVTHKIQLKESDAEYLNSSATKILTYWFVDCVYRGPTLDYTFVHNYTNPDEAHEIAALVVASYESITTPAPSTTVAPTTTKPTMTTSVTPTTTKITTSTASITNLTTTVKPKSAGDEKVRKRRTADGNMANKPHSGIMVMVNGTLVPYKGSFPYVCLNKTYVAPDGNKTYGYFTKKFTAKAPVSAVTVTGNNWLQHGDVLTLTVKCKGSSTFNYCVHFMKGLYNVTGAENCTEPIAHETEVCEFMVHRYFIESGEYTIVVVLANDVAKVVSPVTVTVYKVNKQAQLSVIVIPVVFSFLAVVLIVFGVAYYIQNRSRFTVEVADFNFGQSYSDMEYKTFKERLRDSLANAFVRVPSPSNSEPTVWPPGRKYGSLT